MVGLSVFTIVIININILQGLVLELNINLRYRIDRYLIDGFMHKF